MIDKLEGWLEKQGFSLEMRTASAFREAGFGVKQSAHYYDRGLAKDREIDVIAIPTPNGADKEILVSFAIECKSSDKPWVVLMSSDTLVGIPRWRSWGILTHESVDAFESGSVVSTREIPWYSVDDEFGYSFRKAFTERDDGFAASSAVCKAAQYLVLPMQADSRELPPYAVAFPIIVVDTPIVECRLDSGGRIQLSEVSRSEFLFEDHQMFDAWVRIRVIHIDEVPKFTQEAQEAAADIRRILRDLPLSTECG